MIKTFPFFFFFEKNLKPQTHVVVSWGKRKKKMKRHEVLEDDILTVIPS